MLMQLEGKFTLTIATNASLEFANKMIEHLSITHYFDFVIGADCVENPKPHPDMLIKTLKKFNLESKESLLVGDSLKDQRAAQAAAIDNILVNWGFTQHCETKSFACTKTLTEELLKFK